MSDPPLTLLLIAPDEAVRLRLAGLLDDRSACGLRRVATGAAALATVAERSVDAVLLEQGADDSELVAALMEEDPHLPVIVLGDPSGADAIVAARAAGASDHLPRTTLDADTLDRALRYATEHRRSVERLSHGALHDALTGLPNRTLFLDRLEQALRRTRRRGANGARTTTAVLFFDLDRFKVVNDSLGHAVGDQLLQAVALRLDEALRPSDTVARMGGDEFTVLLEDVADEREACLVAERMLASLRQPFVLAGRELHVSGSIGVALAGSESAAHELIRDADVAMYRAKAGGKARHAVFDPRASRGALTRLDLETELRRAIEAGTLGVHYQPVFRTFTRAIAGFEALVRWKLEPRELVALAEETGLIVALGRFVLQDAVQRAAEWGLGVSVNVTARELLDPGFPATVRTALRRSGARPADLRLEVTEAALSRDSETALRTLRVLHEHDGVGAHLDDFGTGASSLRFLQRFPGDRLSVDASLVLDMLTDPSSYEIVKAAIGLAQSLGLEAIAEGVESAAHLERLEALGCGLVQGFHLSPPLSAAAITKLLEQTTQ